MSLLVSCIIGFFVGLFASGYMEWYPNMWQFWAFAIPANIILVGLWTYYEYQQKLLK